MCTKISSLALGPFLGKHRDSKKKGWRCRLAVPYIRADTRDGHFLCRPRPAAWEREFQLNRLGWMSAPLFPARGWAEGQWLAHGCCHFLGDVNSPSDFNPRRGSKYRLDHRDTHLVYMEHMVLMLCAHEIDGLTGLPHTYITHLPLPNVPFGCDKKHRGLDPTANAKFSSQETQAQTVISYNHPHRDYALNTHGRLAQEPTKQEWHWQAIRTHHSNYRLSRRFPLAEPL